MRLKFRRMQGRRLGVLALFLLALLLAAQPAFAYAVDTHAALVDLIWNDSIRPLLLKRYPGTTEAELREAHAFAYGGCVIQDLGYYPFGKEIFSNLAHYVRSGDFVTALLHNAKNANELAFAIGALAHFVGDSFGHARAVNPSVGITFPDLAKKYGSIVTYEDGRIAHGRVELASMLPNSRGIDMRHTPIANTSASRFQDLSWTARSTKRTD